MGRKVWFITGTSRGFGHEWTTAALERGDRVVATARKLDALKPLADQYPDALLPLELDVTDKHACTAARDGQSRLRRPDRPVGRVERGRDRGSGEQEGIAVTTPSQCPNTHTHTHIFHAARRSRRRLRRSLLSVSGGIDTPADAPIRVKIKPALLAQRPAGGQALLRRALSQLVCGRLSIGAERLSTRDTRLLLVVRGR